MNDPTDNPLFRLLSLLILLAGITACTASQAYRSPSVPHSETKLLKKAGSDTSEFAELESPPDDMEVASATVYLESIERVQQPDTAFLVVKGNFANGCSHLQDVSHIIEDHTLTLDIEGWQPKNRLCTQVLTPFTYLYTRLTTDEVRSLRYYMLRGEKKSF